jgi:hypothetical protein|tara:strand:- start:2430 stop:2561 length:132 start_codon:yes stop_codon:yes gene_type:complete
MTTQIFWMESSELQLKDQVQAQAQAHAQAQAQAYQVIIYYVTK